MNDNRIRNDSILREYINPETREKAPEDFTLNTMSHILSESAFANPAVVKEVNRASLITTFPLWR